MYELRVDLAAAEARAKREPAAPLDGLVTRKLADGARVHRDFPRVHPLREGRVSEYVYVAASPDVEDGDPFFPFQSIQKVSATHAALTWTPARPGCYVGEPVFAPSRDAGAAEDDGWLLVLVHDVPAAASELVILDAKTLTAVAELRVDTLLPLGLHGSWSADA